MASLTPEQQARERIDHALEQAGWIIQDYDDMNIDAGLGVAIREYRMKRGHGFADYLLYVDGEPCGALEAKRADSQTVSSVMHQAKKYSDGLPNELDPPIRPLPDPPIIAQEIANDLRASLAQIEDVLADLQARADKLGLGRAEKETP